MSIPLPDKSNFISIGAWNPAIIQPAWLKKELPDLVPEEEIPVQVTTGSFSSFRMEYEKFLIDPSGGRLLFIPRKLDNSTLELIAKLAKEIRKRLIYTPISASGCNFAFKLEEGESFTIDEGEQEDKIKELYDCIGDSYNFVSRGIRNSFSAEDHSINIFYEYIGKDKTFQINYDYKQPSNSMRLAADALVENYSNSLKLKDSLIRRS